MTERKTTPSEQRRSVVLLLTSPRLIVSGGRYFQEAIDVNDLIHGVNRRHHLTLSAALTSVQTVQSTTWKLHGDSYSRDHEQRRKECCNSKQKPGIFRHGNVASSSALDANKKSASTSLYLTSLFSYYYRFRLYVLQCQKCVKTRCDRLLILLRKGKILRITNQKKPMMFGFYSRSLNSPIPQRFF